MVLAVLEFMVKAYSNIAQKLPEMLSNRQYIS